MANPVEPSGCRPQIDFFHNLYNCLGVTVAKGAIQPLVVNSGERRLVKLARFYYAITGQPLDDHLDKADLLAALAVLLKEPAKRDAS